MRENTDQKNSEYGHFSLSEMFDWFLSTRLSKNLKNAVNSEFFWDTNLIIFDLKIGTSSFATIFRTK